MLTKNHRQLLLYNNRIRQRENRPKEKTDNILDFLPVIDTIMLILILK